MASHCVNPVAYPSLWRISSPPQNEFFSLEPSHRIWMSAMDGYMPAIGLNTVIRCFTIGTVVMSSDESKLAVGAQVRGPSLHSTGIASLRATVACPAVTHRWYVSV